MNKVNKILLIAVVILLIAFGVVLYWQKGGFEQPYYAVYMTTGDLYFGKLSHFPKLSLSDVWLLQRNENSENPFGITRFDKAFWGPEDEINVDSKNIVWTTKLKNDSQLTEFFRNPQTAQTQGQNQQNATSTNQ